MWDKTAEVVISSKEKPLLSPKEGVQKQFALRCWEVIATVWKNSLMQCKDDLEIEELGELEQPITLFMQDHM